MIYLNPPPNFITILFYDTYVFSLITSKLPDARGNRTQLQKRIRHTCKAMGLNATPQVTF